MQSKENQSALNDVILSLCQCWKEFQVPKRTVLVGMIIQSSMDAMSGWSEGKCTGFPWALSNKSPETGLRR